MGKEAKGKENGKKKDEKDKRKGSGGYKTIVIIEKGQKKKRFASLQKNKYLWEN